MAVLLITALLVGYVYVLLYRLTQKKCWENLRNSAETVSNEFSKNLQYQTLYLWDYTEVLRKNNLIHKEQLRDFMSRYVFSSDLYEIFMILPDSTVLSSRGEEYDASGEKLFQNESMQGDHFSGIEHDFFNPETSVIRHYFPVQIEGKVVAILYCVIDLDFLSSEGICEIYNGEADYVIFNPKTKDIYINTFTKGHGSLYDYLDHITEQPSKGFDMISHIEARDAATVLFDSKAYGKKIFAYSIPTSSEYFSVCIFTSAEIAFNDVYKFKKMSFSIISILAFCYLIYLLLMFKFTKDRVEQSILEEKVEKAEKAALSKTIFLSNMSHDIRTPMNAIIGYINLAAMNLGNKVKSKQYLSKSIVACDHLLNLINEVLDMSRIESGKVCITESENNLSEIIDSVESLLNVQLHAKNQDFIVDKSNLANPYVLCDKLHFSQVIINLLSNAVKFTQEGGRVSFTVNQYDCDEPEKKDSAIYEFIIKDNGVGMSREFLKHVFEPFERDNNVEGKVQGTGLGLSISKRLIDFMNGTVDINSEENEGTEITVRLCFKKIEQKRYDDSVKLNKKTNSTEACSDMDFKNSKFNGKTLLLVDDNDFNREIAVEILEGADFYVEEACNGLEAVEKITKSLPGHYSAVLMDIQMPVMNGYEASRMIRALPDKELAKIPIVALSANAFEEDIEKAKQEKINAYIVKPINIKKLFDVLENILE